MARQERELANTSGKVAAQDRGGAEFGLRLSRWFFSHFPFERHRGLQWTLLFYIFEQKQDEFTMTELRSAFHSEAALKYQYVRERLLLRDLLAARFVSLKDEHGRPITALAVEEESEDATLAPIKAPAASSRPHGSVEARVRTRKRRLPPIHANVTVLRTTELVAAMTASLHDIGCEFAGGPLQGNDPFSAFRAIYGFMKHEMNPKWRTLIEKDLACLSGRSPNFIKRALTSAGYWLVLLALWRLHEKDGRSTLHTLASVNKLIHSEGGLLDPTELQSCLKELNRDHIVHCEMHGNQNRYVLAEAAIAPLDAYNRELLRLRERFVELLSPLRCDAKKTNSGP